MKMVLVSYPGGVIHEVYFKTHVVGAKHSLFLESIDSFSGECFALTSIPINIYFALRQASLAKRAQLAMGFDCRDAPLVRLKVASFFPSVSLA
jgi:hypothetical protein